MNFALFAFLLLAQSSSELLQKGIYLQETVGDLDGAMKAYRQVAQLAQESRANAAQAQLRLGICLEKKGLHEEAARTFQKLVNDYPDQPEVAAKARGFLPSGLKLLLAPWSEGEVLDFAGQMGTQVESAVNVRYSVRGKTFETRYYNPATQFAMRVDVEPDSMRPVFSHINNPMFGDTETRYQGSEAHVQVKGKDPKTVAVEGPVFDENEIAYLLRRLPLAAGYQTTLQIFSAEALEPSKMRIAVTGIEDIETPAGNFHAYKVELNAGGQVYWISTDASRYPVKLAIGNAMSATLTSINSGSGVYRDDQQGISFTLPSGWTAGAAKLGTQKMVQLIDPDSLALITLTVEPRKLTTPPTTQGMRKEVEQRFERSQFPPQKLRPDSWRESQVGGHPSLSWISDSTRHPMSDEPMTIYTIAVRSDGFKAEFVAKMVPGDFEAFRSRLDAIVETFTLR